MMADILENVLSGRILLHDFQQWLISDAVENCTEKANFIPYFLNYVKEDCAWLISKDVKCLESPSFKFSRDKQQSDRKDNAVNLSDKRILKSPVELNSRNESHENVKSVQNYFHGNRQNRFQEDTKTKTHSSREEFMAREQLKIGVKSYQKSQYSARKSLNFSDSNDTKKCIPSGQVFEENIQSYDAFPPLGQKTNERKPHDSKTRRRITPTPVQVLNKGSLKFGASKFAMPPEKAPNEVFKKTPFIETSSSNLQSERELLKMTRNQLSQSATLLNTFNDMKIENNVSPVKPVTIHYVVPDPENISHRNQLEIFSTIYEVLLTNALVPNITSELYFIFELLTSKVSSKEKCDDKKSIFCTIHNCVFFGVTVLSKLKHMLNLLDKNTLCSLCEIPFLPKFSPELASLLQSCCDEKQEITTKSLSLNRVPFLLEEDSKENFIDSNSFSSFRKQRDLFYELLRDWQQQPLDSVDVKFQENFSRKAKFLISLGPNAVNMYHLARLLQNQLIASCLGLEVNEVYDDLLIDIQKNFPAKFEKLRQRFLMPFCVGEPNPPPTFYGIQAFFCELIQAASSATLNQQLLDIFVCKILEFNSTDVYFDGEVSSLGIIKEKYTFLLHTLRLLGKFLGYIYFLPYKVSEPMPASIISNQLNCRKNSVPPLDILALLKAAVEKKRIILTVPWIVEYLSMIDPVAKNLPYIEETLKVLVAIYRGKYVLSSNSLNFWFLKIIIGWLFDVLHYPSKYCSLLQPITFAQNPKCKGLDLCGIVDRQLVHSCCPYLIEFKVLIYSYVNGIKSRNKREIRKITPLSTMKPHISASVTKQQMEIQLEENFFFLHPPSLKKTVEFVSERAASKVINKIRSEITEFKLHSIEYITSQEKYKTLMNSTDGNPNKLKSYVDSCISELYEKSRAKITDLIHVSCQKDIQHIMPYLLSDDARTPVLEMCCKISFRYAVDKVVDWCDVNLILTSIEKDIKNKLTHLSKEEGQGDTAKEKPANLSSIISSLRQAVVNISSLPQITSIDHTLSEVSSVMVKKIGVPTKKLILSLTVDLYIALIIHYPEKYNEFHKTFVDIWTLNPKHPDLECYYLGVPNIKFLLAAKDFKISCEKFIDMLSFLINNGIFQVDKAKHCLTNLKSLQWQDSRCNQILCLISDTVNVKTAVNSTN